MKSLLALYAAISLVRPQAEPIQYWKLTLGQTPVGYYSHAFELLERGSARTIDDMKLVFNRMNAKVTLSNKVTSQEGFLPLPRSAKLTHPPRF